MFTGLVETTGKIISIKTTGGKRLEIESPFSGELREGESISVDGVCLSVESFNQRSFTVYLSPETLKVTKFGVKLKVGQKVNLERSMKPEDRFGGHIVLGHVDTVATLKNVRKERDSVVWEIGKIERRWMKYLVEKGSVAVDGVSLTVNRITRDGFSVQLIPITLDVTTFGEKRPGDILNIEFDIIGKYVESLLKYRLPAT